MFHPRSSPSSQNEPRSQNPALKADDDTLGRRPARAGKAVALVGPAAQRSACFEAKPTARRAKPAMGPAVGGGGGYRQEVGSEVRLNVYDMSVNNDYSYWCGLGIFHSGVEVYGREYAYGGHDFPSSGIFETKPKDVQALGAPTVPIHFRESVFVGFTELGPDEVHDVIERMGDRFRGLSYHLLTRNCNHFSQELCQQLTGRGSPGWVNRLAFLAVALHCLLPKGLVPPLPTPSAPPTAPPIIHNPTFVQEPPSRDTDFLIPRDV